VHRYSEEALRPIKAHPKIVLQGVMIGPRCPHDGDGALADRNEAGVIGRA
jgi:hypothetical protein